MDVDSFNAEAILFPAFSSTSVGARELDAKDSLPSGGLAIGNLMEESRAEAELDARMSRRTKSDSRAQAAKAS